MRNRGCCATIRGVNELSLQPRLKTVSQFPLLFIYFAVGSKHKICRVVGVCHTSHNPFSPLSYIFY